MGIIEQIICKLFPYEDILRDDTPDIYLRRWFIYPRDKDFGKNKGKGRIYLHKFYRGDEDDFLHDHPWPFTSLILTRGYFEETPSSHFEWDYEAPELDGYERSLTSPYEVRKRKFYPRFSILRRPATWRHRVILKDRKPVWTVVKTGVKERSWGFWIRDKFCPWRNYKSGVCWCAEETTK